MATLKPPSTTQPRSSSSTPSRAPLKADSSATISDTAVFQGTHPITIGAGTVIHPRARFYSYSGPIIIGDACIISEKVVIGASPDTDMKSGTSTPASSSSSLPDTNNITQDGSEGQPGSDSTIRISYFVTIAPLATILPGSQIHSSATIDSRVTIHPYADVGSHARICSGCEVPRGGKVGEWVVVWGSRAGQWRRRARESKSPCSAVVRAAQVAQMSVPGSAPEGKLIEDARLMVLQKEREVLGRMISVTGKKR